MILLHREAEAQRSGVLFRVTQLLAEPELVQRKGLWGDIMSKKPGNIVS